MCNRNLKISIIVPVYNVEMYLPQCLGSLCAQSYPHIEIICVNDGSTDGSLDILSHYAHNDARITVIDQPNQGVAAARNAGVQKASGAYIMFVDGDDWVSEDICSQLYTAAIDKQADCVMCSYVKEFKAYSVPEHTFNGDCIFQTRSDIDTHLRMQLFGPSGNALSRPEKADNLSVCWRQLWKAEICKSITFEDLALIGSFEDGLFQIQALAQCQVLAYIDKPLYHYRKDNAGSITSTYRPRLVSQWEALFEMMADLACADANSQALLDHLSNRIALSMIGLGLNEASADHSFKQKYQNIRSILQKEAYKEAYRKLDYSHFPVWWLVFFKACKWQMPSLVLLLLLAIQWLRKRRK